MSAPILDDLPQPSIIVQTVSGELTFGPGGVSLSVPQGLEVEGFTAQVDAGGALTIMAHTSLGDGDGATARVPVMSIGPTAWTFVGRNGTTITR